MTTTPISTLVLRPARRTAGLTGALCLILLVASAAPATAQTAAALYERAEARESAVRAAASPDPDTARTAARAYENVVRRYPSNGYTDNALWQAAGLMVLAFEQSGEDADLARAVRYLEWLRDEYPHSRMVPDAKGRIAELLARPSAAAERPREAAPRETAAAGATAEIRLVTREKLPKGDRITIELSREVAYNGDRVDSPDRLFFDFVGSLPSSSVRDASGALDGTLVRGFRLGQHPNETTRVVFELEGRPRHSAFLLYDPFRLVIDLESDAVSRGAPPAPAPFPTPRAAGPARGSTQGASTGGAAVDPVAPPVKVATPPPTPEGTPPAEPPPAIAVSTEPVRAVGAVTGEGATATLPPAPPIEEPAGRPEPPSSTSRGDYSLARQLGLGVSRIVIDPGHGGHDPGAEANGVIEAELVLDIAARLEKLLTEHPGVEVLLTRTDDRFIPLEDRTAFANREGADLFLSIHANASRQVSTRGVETYVLNFATNEAAEAVAARENATSARSMGNLPDIVKTIALNDKLAESRELATMVQTALVRSLRTQSSGVRDLGVKQAPFVVLIGAAMPSVLAEVSFLTNGPEAALLKRADYRQRIAQALHDALVKYQASLKKITTVASRDESR